MPWYIFSIMALVMVSVYTICQKWALNLKISPKVFLLIYFVGGFLAFLLVEYRSLVVLLTGDLLISYLLWGFLVAVFSMAGNMFSIKAMSKAPNPAYIKAIESSNSIVIVFASVWLFQSPITLLRVAGIILVLVGLLAIILEPRTTKNPASGLWYLLGFAAMLSFSCMILVTKHMLNLGFKAQEVLLVLFFFATINFLVINKFSFKKRDSDRIDKPSLLAVAVSLAMIGAFVSNFSHFYSLSVAPNPGYAQAVFSANIVLTLLAARFLLPLESGGSFEWKKWLGVCVVTAGILIVILG